jgi:tetrahydromethanopterin:alpha-L-glutamate ligase
MLERCITNCSMPRSPERAAERTDRPTILVVSDQRDWHARQMEAAFRQAGARVERVDLAGCGFDTRSASGLALPILGSQLPDAVHVRTLSAGSFEAVTKRLGVLHALANLGVVVWNDARAIERCVDKSMTSFLLARAGLPTPPTWTMESAEAARALVEREAPRGPLVLKPLFGAQGKGLRLIHGREELPGPEEVAGVYYLQRFQPNGTHDFRDYRLFVLRGRVIAAMMRRASTWITNVKQGGQPLAVARDPEMERLAIAATDAVGAAIAGVDVLVGADGAPTVLEVNSMPAWSGLQKVSKRNIAKAIASALMDELARRPAQRRAL